MAVEEATLEAGAKAEAEPTRAAMIAAVFMVVLFIIDIILAIEERRDLDYAKFLKFPGL
jgi:hypothetical protein